MRTLRYVLSLRVRRTNLNPNKPKGTWLVLTVNIFEKKLKRNKTQGSKKLKENSSQKLNEMVVLAVIVMT